MVTILPCQTKKDRKLLEELPELIHPVESNYVPPFPGSISKIFDPVKSPFKRHGDIYPFIAYRDGKPVGRIAAIVNHSHNAYYKDKLGFFGYFDFIDDEEISRALFAKAKEVLKEKGCVGIRGPYSPSMWDESGLLVKGFDRDPFLFMIYNPPYYEKHYEKLGLKKARDLFCYLMTAEQGVPERVLKISRRVATHTGIKVRSVSLKNLKEELRIIHSLFNQTISVNWGFYPIHFDDIEVFANDLKTIADPEMVLIAEKDGKPVGFSMTLPNINELLAKTKKQKGLWRILKAVWLLKTKHPSEARLILLGVIPEYRNKGLGALFYAETFNRGKQRYKVGELSWIDEGNEEMQKAIAVMGGDQYRTYRVYEYGT